MATTGKGFTFFVDATTRNSRFDGNTTLGFVGFDNGREVMRGFRQLSVGMSIFYSEMAAVTDLLGRLVTRRDELFGKRSRQLNRDGCRAGNNLVIGTPITIFGDNTGVVDFIGKIQTMNDADFRHLCRRAPDHTQLYRRLRGLLAVFPKMKMRFVRGCDNHADAPSRNIGVEC